MQIIIDISEKEYKVICENGYIAVCACPFSLSNAIKNGTPLPKGHGDLKDVSKIDYQEGVFLSSEGEPLPIIHKIATIEMIRDWLPTIIKADKETIKRD